MRRAQVTLYVVIGLALLLLVVLFLVLRRNASLANALSAEDAAPVRDLVISCEGQSLERLLRLLGSQGGQLNTSTLRSSPLVWQSETVPLGPQRVPYWSHVTDCPQSLAGCEASAQPALCEPGACTVTQDRSLTKGKSVQHQLEEALPGEVNDCLDGFSALSDRFIVVPKGKASAKIIIGEERVAAQFHMPLLVTEPLTGRQILLQDFQSEAPVALPRLYRLANTIANAERQYTFLESLTLHLISVYSGIDTPLPPMRAFTFLGEKRYWTRSNVEQVLREEVLPWTNLIQVPNARAGYVPLWPVDTASLSQDQQTMYAGILAPLTVVVDNRSDAFYSDIRAEFLYPDERPYLSINGGQELLAPRSADIGGFFQKLIGVFLNDYRFRYDLSYPVIVTLTDEGAFKGTGYAWSFALEANIRKNEPLNRNATVANFQLVSTSVDPTAPQQRVKNTIIVRARDQLTGKPLDGVRISYTCGEEYYIGETDMDGLLQTSFPYCRYGGTVLYSRDGYAGSGVPFDNYLEKDQSLAIGLWPLHDVTITVLKRNATGTAELSPEDLVIVNLARVKAQPEDQDVPLAGYFTLSIESHNFSVDIEAENRSLQGAISQGVLTQQEADDMLAEMQRRADSIVPAQPSFTVQLAPGNYTEESFLILNKQFTIPSEKRKYSSGLFSSKTVTLPEQNFTTWLAGGASLNASEAFEVTAEQLYRSQNLTLYVLEQPYPRSWKELEAYKAPEDFLAGKRSLQLPTWS